MNKPERRAWIFVALLLVCGCETMKAKSDFDPSVDFSHYQTYSWISDHPLLASAPGVSPLAEERIQHAVSEVLAAKGYRFVEPGAAADFVVAFTLGTREVVSVDPAGYPGGFYRPYGWGGPYQGLDVRQHTEGRLAIDLFDTRLRRPVWHGYVTKSITSKDQANPQAVISAAVTSILGKFPPGN